MTYFLRGQPNFEKENHILHISCPLDLPVEMAKRLMLHATTGPSGSDLWSQSIFLSIFQQSCFIVFSQTPRRSGKCPGADKTSWYPSSCQCTAVERPKNREIQEADKQQAGDSRRHRQSLSRGLISHVQSQQERFVSLVSLDSCVDPIKLLSF